MYIVETELICIITRFFRGRNVNNALMSYSSQSCAVVQFSDSAVIHKRLYINKVGLGGSNFPIESYIFKLYMYVFIKNIVRALLLYLL